MIGFSKTNFRRFWAFSSSDCEQAPGVDYEHDDKDWRDGGIKINSMRRRYA